MTDNVDAADQTWAGAAGRKVIVGWLLVGAPLAYGIFQTVNKAAALFG